MQSDSCAVSHSLVDCTLTPLARSTSKKCRHMREFGGAAKSRQKHACLHAHQRPLSRPAQRRDCAADRATLSLVSTTAPRRRRRQTQRAVCAPEVHQQPKERYNNVGHTNWPNSQTPVTELVVVVVNPPLSLASHDDTNNL